MHLDYVFSFTQVPADTGAHLKISTVFHMKNHEGEDASIYFYLKLLKNCYGTRYSPTKWFSILQSGLDKRGFAQSSTGSCIFTRDNCTMFVHADDCLIFRKKKCYII